MAHLVESRKLRAILRNLTACTRPDEQESIPQEPAPFRRLAILKKTKKPAAAPRNSLSM